jgi:hypothetical protein
MANQKTNKPDIKLVLASILAAVALIGGILATIFIRNDSPNPEDSQTSTTNTVEPKEKDNYDTTELKNGIEKVEELYTKFSKHLDAKYGVDAASYDFAEDPEAQAILKEFIGAVDSLDQTIVDSPYDDLKTGWRDFQESFGKRREHIMEGVNEKEDADWAQKLLVLYFLILSKTDSATPAVDGTTNPANP